MKTKNFLKIKQNRNTLILMQLFRSTGNYGNQNSCERSQQVSVYWKISTN